MEENLIKKLVFFGCPMDCDEKYDSIQDKLSGLWVSGNKNDPFDAVMAAFLQKKQSRDIRDAGSIDVPPWLLPKPSVKEHSRITSEEFIAFIDQDGCRKFADKVASFVFEEILPDIPCMIGIDHSITGGSFKSVARYHGKENVTLIVIDTHTDAIPMSAHAEAIQYDIDTNPSSLYDPEDPYLYNRPDSYNASSFLYHMLEEESVIPENLFILGVADYPEKKTFRIKDPRIVKFAEAFSRLKGMGCKIFTQKECLMSPKKIRAQLNKISTPYVYISIDMDIGAMNSLEGVRFRNWKGLKEKKIYKLLDTVCSIFPRGVKLAGMDIMEIDPRRAGNEFSSGKDKTYEIAANLITKISASI